MIDDYAKAMELVRKMETQLPIPARPTSAFIRVMRERGVKIRRDQELQIKKVLYLGDEGGISCDVTPPDVAEAREVIIVSITHLRVDPHHPLAREIRAYQRERNRKIALSGRASKPTQFTLRPRGKRRRRR